MPVYMLTPENLNDTAPPQNINRPQVPSIGIGSVENRGMSAALVHLIFFHAQIFRIEQLSTNSNCQTVEAMLPSL